MIHFAGSYHLAHRAHVESEHPDTASVQITHAAHTREDKKDKDNTMDQRQSAGLRSTVEKATNAYTTH